MRRRASRECACAREHHRESTEVGNHYPTTCDYYRSLINELILTVEQEACGDTEQQLVPVLSPNKRWLIADG